MSWINEKSVNSSACTLVGPVTATSGFHQAGGTSTTTAEAEDITLIAKANNPYIFFIRMLIMC